MILMYHGKDRYRSLQKLKNLKDHAEAKGARYSAYDFESLDEGVQPKQAILRLEQDLDTQSLFPEKRLIVVRGILGLKKEELEMFCKRILGQRVVEDVVLAIYVREKLPKSHLVHKTLLKLGTKIDESAPYTGAKLVTYVSKMIHDAGLHIQDTSVVEAVISLGKEDLFLIEIELNRLKNLLYPNNEISREMVETLQPPAEHTIFAVSQYLFGAQYPKLIHHLQELQAQGMEGLSVLGYLSSQIKKALFIKDARERGIKTQEAVEGHPYALQILERQVSQTSTQQLLEWYKHIAHLDYQAKFEGLDPFEALMQFALRESRKGC